MRWLCWLVLIPSCGGFFVPNGKRVQEGLVAGKGDFCLGDVIKYSDV